MPHPPPGLEARISIYLENQIRYGQVKTTIGATRGCAVNCTAISILRQFAQSVAQVGATATVVYQRGGEIIVFVELGPYAKGARHRFLRAS